MDYALNAHPLLRTLLDTAEAYDAAACGLPAPIPPELGGLRLVFDGRPPVTSLRFYGMDGELEVVGRGAIMAVAHAAAKARSLACR